MARPDTEEYRKLFLGNVPIMDVRAPVEFDKGAFPTAINLPLMSDDERREVGIMYKTEGQDAAIKLGHELVSGDIKNDRANGWLKFAQANPEGYLYCFRGGLRSRTAQQFMRDAGTDYPLITGGYKAMRRFLIDETEQIVANRDFIVIGGRTGTGKTLLIHDLLPSVDLEGLANHRGSSFGRSVDDMQPSQINFENALAIDLMKVTQVHEEAIFLEDESPRIGRLSIPLSLVKAMATSPMVIIEEPLEARIDIIAKDYVTDLLAIHINHYDDDGFDQYSAFLLVSLDRVKKRLGGERHAAIRTLMEAALNHQQKTGEEHLHRAWIERLLVDYYDPMYDYQLAKKEQDVLFKGTRAEIFSWWGKPQ